MSPGKFDDSLLYLIDPPNACCDCSVEHDLEPMDDVW